MHQIILEGPDGSGKSTLAQSLCDDINNNVGGWKARVFREPGDSIQGLRELVLHGQATGGTGESQIPCTQASAALFIAGMAQTAVQVQEWAGFVSAGGEIPVALRDRSILTTLIYQGFMKGGPTMVRAIWTAYRSLVDESFDQVIVMTGSHGHQGPEDHFTDLGQHRHVRHLYIALEGLLGPGRDNLDPTARDPRLEAEMARAMSNPDRQAFNNRFKNWLYIDKEYDAAEAAALAFIHLQRHYAWNKS